MSHASGHAPMSLGGRTDPQPVTRDSEPPELPNPGRMDEKPFSVQFPRLWRLLRLHIHRDPTWQLVGTHRYRQCRCGARRTTEAYANLFGPVAPGWPRCRDEHGRSTRSSGWVMPPPGGWTTSGYPVDLLEPRKWARANPGMGRPVSPDVLQRVIDIDPPEYDVLPPG